MTFLLHKRNPARRLRYKLGVWLLMPWLYEEARLARASHEKQEQGPLERYWMGRQTAIHRLLFGDARHDG